jgi:hypothetical protein
MADKNRSNELSGKCGSCRKKKSMKEYYVIIVIGGSIGNVPTPLFMIDVDVTKPWFCLMCKQARILMEQEENILDLRRELALAYDQIDKFKAENSSSTNVTVCPITGQKLKPNCRAEKRYLLQTFM